MTNPLFRGFRRIALLSVLKPLSTTSSTSFRPILGNPESSFLHLPRLIPQNPCWEWRNFSHGKVNFVITRDGKPKFETHEVEAPKKEKWKTKKKLKLQRKREKKKRKVANKRDPRRLGVKGKKKKQKFDTPEERIKHKIENAKVKEAMLIERLKRYEVSKVQGPEVQPHFLTGEERFYIKKMAQKKSNYVPIGRRGVFGGVILNMHLHWKRHETVKVICKPCKPGQIQEYANEIARLSGGIPIQIVANDTIVFYRGREYVQPEIMYPIDTLSKKRALEKSKYEQSLESVRRFIAIAEKELELYYRHVALYDDPNNRSSYSILDDLRSTSEKQNGKIGEENYSSSESIASDLELSQIDEYCSDDKQSLTESEFEDTDESSSDDLDSGEGH
ncbi:putative CRM domain-containing protein, chloroplastic [Capsicum galapagoense]